MTRGEVTDAVAVGRSVVAVVQADITAGPADAIVNAANTAFAAGGGVDGALRAAAGPELSGEMRRRYPMGIPTGSAASTGAYNLPAHWVIHAVGPAWGAGGQDKLDLLRDAYRSLLAEAERLGARPVCSPLIGSGTFGFPAETAADVAVDTVAVHLKGETVITRFTFVVRERGYVAIGHQLSRLRASSARRT